MRFGSGGATVAELLRGLERAHPSTAGWIVDERSCIRRHINVFVNGERGSEWTAVGSSDSWFTAATRLPPVFSITASK